MISPASRLSWPSVGQLLLSGLGILTLLPLSAGMFLLGLLMAAQGEYSRSQSLPLFSLGWAAALVSLLLLPSLLYTLFRLLGSDRQPWRFSGSYRLSTLLILLWPLLVAAGGYLSQAQMWSWLLLPPIQLLVVCIPLWWLIEIGQRGLQGGSPQRKWGLLSFGLLVSPLLIIVIEMILLAVVFILAGIWLGSQPEALDQLNRLAARLANAEMQPDVLERALRPYLLNPTIIFSTLAVAAGLVPLIEEIFKPLALWTLAKKQITPQQGFVGGLICGASFALLETLGVLVGSAGLAGGDWPVLALGRLGTGLLHIVTTALVGWGLASAWSQGRYLHLALSFLIAVFYHSTWNFFSLLMGAGSLFDGGANLSALAWAARLAQIAPLALAVLMIALLVTLIGGNRRLRSTQSSIQ